jgi:hypothetical protein
VTKPQARVFLLAGITAVLAVAGVAVDSIVWHQLGALSAAGKSVTDPEVTHAFKIFHVRDLIRTVDVLLMGLCFYLATRLPWEKPWYLPVIVIILIASCLFSFFGPFLW